MEVKNEGVYRRVIFNKCSVRVTGNVGKLRRLNKKIKFAKFCFRSCFVYTFAYRVSVVRDKFKRTEF